MTTPRTGLILIARIGGAHGIRGEVRAQIFAEDPPRIATYGQLVDSNGRAFEVVSIKPAKSVFILKLKSVADRTAAETLNGVELFVPRERLPEEILDDDEFYFEDLVGLAAFDANGSAHGTVIAVHDFGAGIVLELKPDEGASVMIPFSEAAVPEIDVEAGSLVVEPVAAGLIDGTDADGVPDRPGRRRRQPPGDVEK